MPTYHTQSNTETLNLGQKIAQELKGGEILALSGNLGSGKTVLARGLAQGLQIKKPITSPTFVLMKIYSVKNHPTIKNLLHLDTYRLNSFKDLKDLNLTDYLGRKDSVCLIEWPEKIAEQLPTNTWWIKFETPAADDQRVIEIKKEQE